jgi:hypothetical protein
MKENTNSVSVRALKLASLIVLAVILAGSAFAQKTTEVFVLSAMHQYHGEDNSYTFNKLSEIVEGYRPDVIAVELTFADLDSRKEQKTKREYQKSIFPTADKLKVKMVPMEPADPTFSKLVGLIRASEAELNETRPDASAAFSKYVDLLYGYLFKYWKSASEVNSKQTDALFEVKHNFQNDLFGEKQRLGWEGWNAHFLEKIMEAAKANPGKRIIVIVGAEHSYWLRQKLRAQEGIRLVEPDEVLK